MPSLPLLSLPAYYALAAYPHAYAIFGPGASIMTERDNTSPNGARNQELLKKRLSPKDYAALENMPLFAAAVLGGLFVEAQTSSLVGTTSFAIGGLLLRAAYTWSYLSVTSQNWSYLRSVLHNAQVVWSFVVLVRAAMALG
ncbi:uncharacterized protein LTR77_009012 [Saxophila tyrrhenica]|uniref:Glutathione transferase n=1 Tax=Saxophila tyrrhenica TaxID=1690608 RepID=A0AAV9P1B7_9PEZI|nr:hypothetical protein LTR77_009012 [Saxophila tyrrhenica]